MSADAPRSDAASARDYKVLVEEARIAIRRARDGAEAVKGVPIFLSTYDRFSRIADDLTRVLERQGHRV